MLKVHKNIQYCKRSNHGKSNDNNKNIDCFNISYHTYNRSFNER